MQVELLSIPDCPNVAGIRDLLRTCISELGLAVDFVEDHGDYPSPSILVNGVDVMGDPGHHSASCRLDVPTRTAILKALQTR